MYIHTHTYIHTLCLDLSSLFFPFMLIKKNRWHSLRLTAPKYQNSLDLNIVNEHTDTKVCNLCMDKGTGMCLANTLRW